MARHMAHDHSYFFVSELWVISGTHLHGARRVVSSIPHGSRKRTSNTTLTSVCRSVVSFINIKRCGADIPSEPRRRMGMIDNWGMCVGEMVLLFALFLHLTCDFFKFFPNEVYPFAIFSPELFLEGVERSEDVLGGRSGASNPQL